jgi:hypothetical protein
VNLQGDDIEAIIKNRENLIDASMEVGLEVNVEKTKYMFLTVEEHCLLRCFHGGIN